MVAKDDQNSREFKYPKAKEVEKIIKYTKAKEDACFNQFFDNFREIHIILPLLDIFQGICKYTKHLKDMVTNKINLGDIETMKITEECGSVVIRKMLTRSFTLPI